MHGTTGRLQNFADLTYRPHIDGLRAVAVLCVIAFHYGAPLPGGFIGVDVFFVISGYLISSHILESLQKGNFSLFDFYVRRIKRIVPAALFVIGATCLVALILPSILDRDAVFESAFYSAASLANFYFLAGSGYFASDAATQPLLHYWSLAIEEQFYLFWPVALALAFGFFRKRNSILIFTLAALLVSFAFSIYAVKINRSEAFYLPQFRVWELLAGALLVHVRPLSLSKAASDILRGAGIITIAISAVKLNESISFPGWYALAPCIAAAAIVAPVGSGGRVDQILSSYPMRGIGLISYSLYLWHWPALVTYRTLSGTPPTLFTLGALLAGVFALSYLTWRYIELPVRRWSPPPVVKWLICTSFAVVLFGGVYDWMASASIREWTVERYIVREQIRRAVLDPGPAIGFFGDSSCLTGVYSPIVSADLKTSVSSYCMFGSAGPFVDATIIRKLRERKELPRTIVYMVHAAQFFRTTVVTGWNDFATACAENRNGVLQVMGPAGARLQGGFTARYKWPKQLVDELRSTGSLVDPSAGVNQVRPTPYQISNAYKASLSPLVDTLSKIDRNKIYLVFGPIPEGDKAGDPAHAAAEVADMLGISRDNIIDAPSVMPKELFANNSHLNEHGREIFSHILAQSLAKRLAPTARPN